MLVVDRAPRSPLTPNVDMACADLFCLCSRALSTYGNQTLTVAPLLDLSPTFNFDYSNTLGTFEMSDKDHPVIISSGEEASDDEPVEERHPITANTNATLHNDQGSEDVQEANEEEAEDVEAKEENPDSSDRVDTRYDNNGIPLDLRRFERVNRIARIPPFITASGVPLSIPPGSVREPDLSYHRYDDRGERLWRWKGPRLTEGGSLSGQQGRDASSFSEHESDSDRSRPRRQGPRWDQVHRRARRRRRAEKAQEKSRSAVDNGTNDKRERTSENPDSSSNAKHTKLDDDNNQAGASQVQVSKPTQLEEEPQMLCEHVRNGPPNLPPPHTMSHTLGWTPLNCHCACIASGSRN